MAIPSREILCNASRVVVRGKAARTDPETSNLANPSQSRYKGRILPGESTTEEDSSS
jgi:hypothetical protein